MHLPPWTVVDSQARTARTQLVIWPRPVGSFWVTHCLSKLSCPPTDPPAPLRARRFYAHLSLGDTYADGATVRPGGLQQ